MPIDDTDLGNLPDQTTPGDTDANDPTTFVASRVQAWTGAVWQRVRVGVQSAANAVAVALASDQSTSFDLDSGAGTQQVIGVGLRKAASGGSVELGTPADPIRCDPTGTTTQPVSAASLPLPAGAATSALQGTTFDADTGAGTQSVAGVSLRKSASGGSVELGTPSDPIRTDPTGTTTQPVAAPGGGALALDATLTGGTQRAIVRGAAKGATPAADGTATAQGADHTGVDVQVRDTAGNPLPSADVAARKLFAAVTDGTNVLGTPSDPIRTDPTGTTTQPVAAPGGGALATAANQTTANSSLASIDGKLASPALPGDADANSAVTQVTSRVQAWTGAAWQRVRVGLGLAANALAVVQATDVSTTTADEENASYPQPTAIRGAPIAAAIDAFGNLRARSAVLTDEESFRDDFRGASLLTALTGSVTFTNGQPTLTGSGTLFTQELSDQVYVRASAHADSALARVAEILSDTSALLETNYTGATTTGAAVESNWQIATPAGGSITVGSSLVNLIQSTTNGDVVSISRLGDYLPVISTFRATVSQRIANQTIAIGFADALPVGGNTAAILFTGTDSSRGVFLTSNGSAAADTEATAFLFPTGLDSSKNNLYEIDLSANEATLRINGSVAAVNTIHLPDPYRVLSLLAYQQNTGVPASATTLSIDVFWFQNLDAVNIERAGRAQPLAVRVAPPIVPDATRGIIFGDVALSAITTAAVRRTAYTEQAANFTGSVISSNVNDTAAGTGARTVRIVYYDSSGSGPFVETATLNGTTSVPLAATDKCFIERITVQTVGSGLVNAGTITLRNDAVATVWTIAAGDNQTFAAHHYVAAGKTAYVLDLYHNSTATAANSGSALALKSLPIGVANAAERNIVDTINVGGGASGIVRPYPSQVPVAGPARILAYVTTLSGSTFTYRASFSVSESQV